MIPAIKRDINGMDFNQVYNFNMNDFLTLMGKDKT